MSKSRMGAPKRVAAGLVAGALAVAGLAFTAAPAGAVASVTAQRIQGADRFETAANVCDSVAPTGAANVLLATGRLSFADALTASALAGDRNTCVLLTEQGSLPAATSAQLTQMKSLGTALTGVTILGGTVAVSQAVADQVTALGGLTVDRIEGADRATTAANIATAVGTPGAIGGQGTVIIANGENQFNGADAMAVGPVAARGDGTNPFPILLVEDDTVPAATLTALAAAGIDNVIAVGGPTAISAATLTAAATAAGDATPTRVSGDTREDTAVAIAGLAVQQGLAATEAFIVNGRIGAFSADALVAGPLGDVRGAVTLLASGTSTLGTPAQNYLDANSNRITTVTAIGGTDVVAAATLTTAETAAETVSNDTNQTFTVTPSDTVALPFGTVPSAANTRSYTATVPAGTKVDIVLLPSANVTINSTNGTVTFADAADSNNIADPGTPVATITSVNGVPGAATNEIVSGGTITFTVTSAAAADVIPVVFNDADTDNNLDLVAATPANAQPKAPAEAVGVGGRTIFVPAELAFGTITQTAVTSVNTTLDYFTFAGSTQYFDSNDVFQYGGVPITQAQFEGLLSATDLVSGSYAPEPSGISTFNVVSPEIVAAPTAPAAPAVTGVARNNDAGTTLNDVVLNWTRSAQADVTNYRIVRDVNSNGVYDAGTDTIVTSTATGTTATLANEPVDADVEYLISALGGTTGVESAVLSTGNLSVGGAVTAAPSPLAIDAVQTATGGFGGAFDAGDVFKVVFNTTITAPATGATVRLTDTDGAPATVADFVNGTNANFTVNTAAETVNGLSRAAGTVLTVTVTGAPSTITAGSVAGLQAGASITDQSGISSTAGANWTVGAAGQEVVVDQDATDTDAVVGAATFTTALVTNSAASVVVTFTASEPIDPTSVATGDFTAVIAGSGDETVTGATVGADNRTITVTITGTTVTLATGDTVTMAANSVTDGVTTAPAAPVVYSHP